MGYWLKRGGGCAGDDDRSDEKTANERCIFGGNFFNFDCREHGVDWLVRICLMVTVC